MYTIKITGPAGLGINSTADIVMRIFAHLGYEILSDIEYESRIKGGVNYYDIFIGENTPYLSKYSDIILAFNLESLTKTLPSLKDGGVVFCNHKIYSGLDEETLEGIKNKNITLHSLEINDKYDNIYLLALLVYYLDIPTENIEGVFREIFARKGELVIETNIKIFHNALLGLDFKKSQKTFPQIGEKKEITYGNKEISDGLIQGELEYYSAYPMTPASSILTEIIASKKVPYLQAEDEIAVINSALGASFTGARSAVGTSGGGFALMSEALSFALQAEFPITVIFSQRAGPSTGSPTYLETGDMNYALNPTFGDFEHIVMIPSTLEEGYLFSQMALNFADIYQTIVIVLTDKQFSELSGTFGDHAKIPVERGEILSDPPLDYKRYELTQNGISPRVKVGTKNGDFIATSYEHDEFGATTEDPEMKKLMTQKRWKKLQNFLSEQNISGYEEINSQAKKTLIVSSATSYTAKEFIKNNPEFGLIIIKILKPLDKSLREILLSKQEIIFIENNFSGQLQSYITSNLGLNYREDIKISHLRKYDLMPFYIEDFEELI